ncbi:MAG: universal stress protein [Bryobacteraceae bacterium]|jgi:nucleotide-binding universal stress UspA family protein
MFNIAKILLPIDFSARSTDAADAAAAVAERFGSEIVLLYVLAPGLDLPLPTSAQLRMLHGLAREEAEENMKEFRSNEWRHLGVKRVLQEGYDPATKIVEYASSEHVDLIMMPTHGYGAFRRLLIGSVTAKVLHDASCPVWTAVHMPDTASGITAQPRRIACAVDLGPQSGSILGWASRLSWEFGAPLSVIHVVASLDPRLQEYGLSPEWTSYVINEAKAQLARLLETDAVHGDIHIEIGPIASAVADAARELQADLLVIGRNSHDSMAGRLPTNAYAIIRESPCPVLSV